MNLKGFAGNVGMLIKQFGNRVDFTANGVKHTIKALTNEDSGKISEQVSAQDLEGASGHLILFRMTKSDYEKIPQGMLLPYKGKNYTLRPVRSLDLGDVNFFVAVLGATGGYGG